MIRLIALGLIVAAYAAVCFVSPYGFWMRDAPAVAMVAEVPDGAIPPDIAYQLEVKAIQYRIDRPDLPVQASRVRLGYAFRTFEALKLPFWAYGEKGYVLYADSRKFLQVIPLDDQKLANLNAVAGRDLTAGYKLPWWNYVWGWIFVILIAAYLPFQFAHDARMRRQENEGRDVL